MATTASSTGPWMSSTDSPRPTAWSGPSNVARRFSMSAAPTLPGRALAPMTAIDDGARKCCSAATAPLRSRSPKRRTASGCSAAPISTWSSPGSICTITGKPLWRKTSTIAWLSGRTTAVSVSMPCAAAKSAAAPSSRVPTPRPCHSSATSKATSARRGASGA
jgi:hypothetical protein